MSVPEGSIIITPAQMYESIQKDIGEIKAGQSDLKVALSSVPATVADHETRLRALERFKYLMIGAAAAIGGGSGALVSKLLG